MVRWRQATDGVIISGTRFSLINLQPNYYSMLQIEPTEVELNTKRVEIRPDLLYYGRQLLRQKFVKPKAIHQKIYLTQNATTLEMKKENMTVMTKSTQTPPTVNTDTPQSVSFVSETPTGLSRPSILAPTESDSSVKIAQQCFQAGDIDESNSEAAERHRDITRNIARRKQRRDKRRRKLNKRLMMLLEKQLMEEDEDEGGSTEATLQQ